MKNQIEEYIKTIDNTFSLKKMLEAISKHENHQFFEQAMATRNDNAVQNLIFLAYYYLENHGSTKGKIDIVPLAILVTTNLANRHLKYEEFLLNSISNLTNYIYNCNKEWKILEKINFEGRVCTTNIKNDIDMQEIILTLESLRDNFHINKYPIFEHLNIRKNKLITFRTIFKPWMREAELEIVDTWLDSKDGAKSIIENGNQKVDFFWYGYHDWKFELKLIKSRMSKYYSEMKLLNTPLDIRKYNIHLDWNGKPGEESIVCFGLDRKEPKSLEDTMGMISSWVYNSWEIYKNNRIADTGWIHGNVAWFEWLCQQKGYVMTKERFLNLDNDDKEKMVKKAKSYYKALSEEEIYKKINLDTQKYFA